MHNPTIQPNWNIDSPSRSLFFILLISLIGFYAIGPFFGILVTKPLYPGTFMEMIEALANPVAHPDIKIVMFLLQGVTTFIGFIVFPFLYGKYYLHLTWQEMFGKDIPSPAIGLLVIVLVIVFMV